MPTAIATNDVIKVTGWTISLRGSGESEINSQFSLLLSQYFETGYANRTIINVSKMAVPIMEQTAPNLIMRSSK
jgi:hypothetical protein